MVTGADVFLFKGMQLSIIALKEENAALKLVVEKLTASNTASPKSLLSIEDLKRYLELYGKDRETDIDSWCGANFFIAYIEQQLRA